MPPVRILTQINSLHPTSWWSFSILSSHLRLGLQSGFYPSGVPTKTLNEFIFTICATCPANLIFLDLITRIFCDKYKSWWSSTRNLLLPLILPPLRTKYLSQHRIIQHLRFMTFFSCDVRSSTYIKTWKLHFFYIFSTAFSRLQTGRQRILDGILSTSNFIKQVSLIY